MTETTRRDDAAFLRALPKAELHCHFEGSIPAQTVIELARRNSVRLPTYDPAQLYDVAIDERDFLDQMANVPGWVYQGFARKYQRRITSPADLYGIGLFERFLERFDDVCAVLKTADGFSRAAYDSLVAAAEDSNVRYREMFFHPMSHPDVRYRTMLDGLVDGIRAAEVDRGIIGRLVPAINRDHSAAAATVLAEEIVANLVPEVVGLASDYDEEHLPAFQEAYRIAANAGLPGTAHAGEYGTAQSVREAIEVLGCRRIDHGYAIVDDPELVHRARDEGIHFTAIFSWSIAITDPGCWPLNPPTLPPTQQVSSPIGEMLDAGLSVSINSDDPAFDGFGSLSDEFLWAAGSLRYDRAQMADLCLSAIDAAWLDDAAKTTLRKEFRAEVSRLTAAARRE